MEQIQITREPSWRRFVVVLLWIQLYLTCTSMVKVAHTFTPKSTSNILPCERKRSGFTAISSIFTLAVESTPSSPLILGNEENIVPTTGVTLKIAFDSQNSVADLSSEKSGRFTSKKSLDMVHRLRRVSDAILVGRSTVEIDDCTLTVRRVPLSPPGQQMPHRMTLHNQTQPTRVVLDPKLQLQLDQFQIANDTLETIVVYAVTEDLKIIGGSEEDAINKYYVKTENKDFKNVQYLGVLPIGEQGTSRISTRRICNILEEEFGLHHIMVEGGPNTALQFLKEKMVDRAIIVHAPILFRDPLPSNITPKILEQAGLELVGSYKLGVDSVDCYSRSSIPWPSDPISSWP